MATRAYDKGASKPSSISYTTHKESKVSIFVQLNSVESDYNHYRTTALNSTPDRAGAY